MLLGRLHGVRTPANELLLELMATAVRDGSSPGTYDVDELIGRLSG